MLQNKLLNSIKLPYSQVNGSFAFRQNKAEQFTHMVMKNISGPIKQNGISLSGFARLLKRTLPENLKIGIRKCKAAGSGAELNLVFTKDNDIVNYFLELKTNDNNRIDFLQIPIIAHEIRHLADYLSHPKLLAREQIQAKKFFRDNKFSDFYDHEIYVKELFGSKNDKKHILKIIQYKTQKILKGLSVQDKIDILQNIRYNLILERNAYKTGSKYAKKLYKRNFLVYEDCLYDQTKEYMLDEKIELFKDMILEIIKKERGIHKAKLKKKN